MTVLGGRMTAGGLLHSMKREVPIGPSRAKVLVPLDLPPTACGTLPGSFIMSAVDVGGVGGLFALATSAED